MITTGAHAGTVAGTSISNTATVSYSVSSVPAPDIVSAPASFTVDEIISLTLTWQDGAPVSTSTPDADTPLRFTLTNTGNGTESFTLTRNNALVGDQYDPISSGVPIYVESNGTPGLQTGGGGDTPYAGSVTLAPNSASVDVYVLSDTPGSLNNGDFGDVNLSAASATPGASGAAVGTVLAMAGDSGTDAVVGTALAQASDTGRYLVSGLAVTVNKTRISPVNPADLTPGAVVTYRIVMTLSGSGTAVGLVLDDPIPAGLAYLPGTTTLSGSASCAPCTDGVDGDPVSFSANTVSATLGAVAAPASFTLEFQAQLPN
jgi:uncharacterized repeat protein (TIGR01451 family)